MFCEAQEIWHISNSCLYLVFPPDKEFAGIINQLTTVSPTIHSKP